MKLAIVAALAALALGGDAAAKCARTEQAPLVLTKADSKIAADGGILVGWQNQVYEDADPHGGGDPSAPTGWTAQLGGATAQLVHVTLAPGLSVYKPAKPAAGRLAVRDAKGTALVAVTVGAAQPALAAPKVTRIVSVTSPGFRRAQDIEVTAYVDSVPDDAYALIISPAGKDAHAISFGRPAHDKTGATSVVVYRDPGHCGSNPPGMTAPAVGAKVTLAWIDASGRVSPASAELTVAAEASKP